MAQVMPSIRVTDPQTRDSKAASLSPLERQDTGKLSLKGDGTLSRTPTIRTNISANEQAGQHNGGGSFAESKGQSDAGIDPLSQQILQRTNTSSVIQKLRTQQTDNSSIQSPISPNESHVELRQTPETAREVNVVSNSKTDKKKGVSFLSRIIGNKRKGTLDGANEDASEPGDSRQEGMNAQLFSHTVDNLGFQPKHPQPPAYIKVRSKWKKQREFDRLFLAQELRAGTEKKSTPEANAPLTPQSGSTARSNPIWALEFSKDGKYLAAGGQDKVVRIWAVIATPEDRNAQQSNEADATVGEATLLSAPVFLQKTFREYHGHTGAILDLSWSKNNFLLSSSMDKTVRLWHISRNENLCTFKHSDFVPSIEFHPRDDRFFLAGSLDSKLRLWSIPDKSVAFWSQLPDMITAVAFTPDGKTCIAGTLGGLCMFYETDGLKFQTQLHVKSTRGQNAKGSKITGIQATNWPPGSSTGDVKLLISSNDSRLRLYNFRDKSLEMKFKGHENNCSQIRARFADDTGHIVCGSEDRKAYIWSTGASEGEKRNQRPVEMFDAHNSITTCTVLAPLKTRQVLSASEDPIYDLCNPPPITLVSRAESVISSKAPTEAGSALPTPAESHFKRAAETPAYIARSAHTDGSIIVTADYTGSIKVFRQDCAYLKRIRASENWDNTSVFSKRTGSKLGRPSSIISQRTGRSRRDSTSTQPPLDRIMTWRQDISHGSFDSANGSLPRRSHGRSVSPRKSRMSVSSITRPTDSPSLRPIQTIDTPRTAPSATPKTSLSIDRSSTPSSSTPAPEDPQPLKTEPAKAAAKNAPENLANPLYVYNGQSWAFWNSTAWREPPKTARSRLAPSDADRPELLNRISTISKLSSERSYERSEGGGEGIRCQHCGSDDFKVKPMGGIGSEEVGLFCGKCGMFAEEETGSVRG
ncbi:WD40-repeat-containing domain protein [Dendryphion nanum]|uniref:WD40-repeat-containing domain protein n=1 Tax=Dendryphion nanum TaxID=256645 RepID=A0A9P9EL51_9PLEO|nr:WD40-repeat-containing domain protein [Dendryphion nanum]